MIEKTTIPSRDLGTLIFEYAVFLGDVAGLRDCRLFVIANVVLLFVFKDTNLHGVSKMMIKSQITKRGDAYNFSKTHLQLGKKRNSTKIFFFRRRRFIRIGIEVRQLTTH